MTGAPTASFLAAILAFAPGAILSAGGAAGGAAPPPNFVIIFADDLGYGDLGCFGHPTIRTPHLDRMAREGMKLTQFYSAAEVCTPSRAALLTGRLPIRSGMCSSKRRVLFPDSKGGLPAGEVTLAEALKTKGYATACVGKWHLGHLPEHLPTRHGFDSYFGLPYSNDMDRAADSPKGNAAFTPPKSVYWNVPLMRNEEVVERPADQTTLTRRYTQAAVEFIREKKAGPFFLYLAHTMPHVPLFASEGYLGKSPRGLFGDVVEELDWSAGEVLEALRREGLAERTLVVFTSDNGPWLTRGVDGGSAGLLRDGKGSTWEGGMREPAIAWWPGRIRPGSVEPGLASTLDVFVTCLALAGAPLPADRVIDGVDMTPLLTGAGPSRRDFMLYYRGAELYAARQGPFKAHFITQPAYGGGEARAHDPPLLYHLEHDPSEARDVAQDHPEALARIRKEVERHREGLVAGKPQLD
jgi:arylsulfatase A-like enzyme